jgi:hypothetical protein
VGKPGQTFATGTNAAGYTMLGLAFKMGGGTSSGLETPKTYLLNLYSVSGVTGPDYAVQSSTNLGDWSTLFITKSPATQFLWTDTTNTVLPA